MSVPYLNPRRQPPAYAQHTVLKLMAQRINLLAKMRRKPIQDDANMETQHRCMFEGPLQELENLFESVGTLLRPLNQSILICLQGAAQIVEAASRGSYAKQNIDSRWGLCPPILDTGHGSEARSRGTYILSHASLFCPFIAYVRSALMELNHKGV